MTLTKETFRVKVDCIAQQTELLQKICKIATNPEALLKLVETENTKLARASMELKIQGTEAGII